MLLLSYKTRFELVYCLLDGCERVKLSNEIIRPDIVILGGGISGLWLLNLLRSAGYEVMLIEERALGAGQTLASQGMIHGGIKYTLGGTLTDAAETIAAMPARWRDCLAGHGTLDLRGVNILSDSYYLFSDGRLSSRITAFFGSKAIEGRVTPVDANEVPAAFRDPAFRGLIYKLQDLVLDTDSLVRHLAEGAAGHIYCGPYQLDTAAGDCPAVKLQDGRLVQPDRLILAAGKGNGDLAHQLGLPLTQQLRPLNQVIVSGADLPEIYAHAVTLKSADKPRLTITSHRDAAGKTIWYLGGELAESGVSRSDAEQVRETRQVLEQLLPWIPTADLAYSTLRIDRAEAGQKEEKRPDTPFVKAFDNVIVCWPTKLTLVPLMGDMVGELLAPVAPARTGARPTYDAPRIAQSPWVASP